MTFPAFFFHLMSHHTCLARSTGTLESLWDSKSSPASVLPKSNGAKAALDLQQHHTPSALLTSKFSPFAPEINDVPPSSHLTRQQQQQQQPITLSLGSHQTHAVRTLEEIEAEMREAFAAQRLQNQSPSQQQLHAQGHLRTSSAQRQLPPQYAHSGTPPPRMHPHAQSPRFQQQQQHQIHLLQQQQQQMQLLELQELRDRQQREELEHLQEQLRLEEMERHRQQQLRQQVQQNAQMLQHQRQATGGTPIGDMSYRRQQQVHRVGTPSRLQAQIQQPQPQPHLDAPFQQSMQYLPREIQMQQRLLAEMAQAEFLHSLQGTPVPEGRSEQEMHEMLRAEAMRKIMEAERMEERRKRKLEKIRHMVR
jgi:DNA topoisomerase 2-associated protein PAT1